MRALALSKNHLRSDIERLRLLHLYLRILAVAP
jgi:hypothetical protein